MDVLDNKRNEILKRVLEQKSSRGLSDLAFEKKFALPSRTVSNWKRGKSNSYLKILPLIANEFEISLEYLMGNSNELIFSNKKQAPSVQNEQEALAVYNEFVKYGLLDETKELGPQIDALIKFFKSGENLLVMLRNKED